MTAKQKRKKIESKDAQTSENVGWNEAFEDFDHIFVIFVIFSFFSVDVVGEQA